MGHTFRVAKAAFFAAIGVQVHLCGEVRLGAEEHAEEEYALTEA